MAIRAPRGCCWTPSPGARAGCALHTTSQRHSPQFAPRSCPNRWPSASSSVSDSGIQEAWLNGAAHVRATSLRRPMRAPRFTPALALALAITLALATAGCGQSNPRLLPQSQADRLSGTVDEVAQLVADGDCAQAHDAVTRAQQQVS